MIGKCQEGSGRDGFNLRRHEATEPCERSDAGNPKNGRWKTQRPRALAKCAQRRVGQNGIEEVLIARIERGNDNADRGPDVAHQRDDLIVPEAVAKVYESQHRRDYEEDTYRHPERNIRAGRSPLRWDRVRVA